MDRLSRQVQSAQKEFDAFNIRLSEYEFPESCKGQLILQLWEDYDQLQILKAKHDLTNDVSAIKQVDGFTKGKLPTY